MNMFKINDANFFKTDDGEQLFYTKNYNKLDTSKPVLVFNYGLVCSNFHWQFQLKHLDELGYQLLIHDYRGHFQSTGNNHINRITFPQIAKDVHDMCGYLGIKKSLMLGHSMGVNICLQIAKDYPDLVIGMILISGTIMPVKDIMFDTNLMDFIAPLVMAGLDKYPDIIKKTWASSGLNPIVRNIVHASGFNKDKVSKEFIEIYLNRVGQLGIDIFLQLFNEMTKQNISVHLSKLNIPVLVMGGHKDNVIPNHLQHLMASLLPNAETYFLKDGSHVPQADFPDFVNERIDLFLNQKL